MIKLFFTAKNKKYSIDLERGQDLLLALDTFIKSNRLRFTHLKNIKVRCFDFKDSVSCRIAKIISVVLSLRSRKQAK